MQLTLLLLYSVGRVGATASLNLAAAGLEADGRGRLKVNEHYQTAQPHIYAVGDVIGFPALASTSAEQGRLASCHAFGVACESLPHLFPYGIYSIPEISMVGKTEEDLTKGAVPYETGVAHFREIARGAIVTARAFMATQTALPRAAGRWGFIPTRPTRSWPASSARICRRSCLPKP